MPTRVSKPVAAVIAALITLISTLSAPVAAQSQADAAAGVGVVIASRDYAAIPDPRDALSALGALQGLRAAGFETFQGRDLSAGEMATIMGQVAAAMERGERLIVFLSGRYAMANGESYLIAKTGNGLGEFGMGARGLALREVVALMAQYPGAGLLVLGHDMPTIRLGGAEVTERLLPNPPPGVLVVEGRTRDLQTRLTAALASSDPVGVAEVFDGVGVVTGVVPSVGAYFPGQAVAGPVGDADAAEDVDAELELWRLVADISTVAAYQSYLDQYPDGRFTGQARQRITALTPDPVAEAEAREQALDLTRAERRAIQRNLSVLGFNTRGVDGIFGPGTRSAIGDWQTERGFGATGFLSGNQITVLRLQADVRRAEIKREEEARAEAELQADLALWEATGQGTREAGMRQYLERFPEGQFAAIARERLAEIDAARVAEADDAAWAQAQSRGDRGGYRAYLRAFPDGQYVGEARAALRDLQGDQPSADVEAARRAEAQVAGNSVTRVLIERRLAQLGYNPGQIDGRFVDRTRAALRDFQSTAGVPVTGYVDQRTLVSLLAAR
ncbi:MAG: peptidoglycan-binding domain-containing protein [Pseudomonadota bacterium]